MCKFIVLREKKNVAVSVSMLHEHEVAGNIADLFRACTKNTGLMAREMDSQLSQRSSPARGHCFVFFGQDSLISECLSLPRCINGYP